MHLLLHTLQHTTRVRRTPDSISHLCSRLTSNLADHVGRHTALGELLEPGVSKANNLETGSSCGRSWWTRQERRRTASSPVDACTYRRR